MIVLQFKTKQNNLLGSLDSLPVVIVPQQNKIFIENYYVMIPIDTNKAKNK